jgi:hypothetical protein
MTISAVIRLEDAAMTGVLDEEDPSASRAAPGSGYRLTTLTEMGEMPAATGSHDGSLTSQTAQAVMVPMS